MREPRSPVSSSQKCGRSQPWWRAISSGFASGSIMVVGYAERPISTIRAIETSPSWILFMRTSG